MLTSEQIADGWIEHDGFGCPVRDCPPGGIYVMLRCGIMGWVTPTAKAWTMFSPQTSISYYTDTDIIAYRPETNHAPD